MGGECQAHFEGALLAVCESHGNRSFAPGQPDFAGDGSGFMEKRRLRRDGPPERKARTASRLHRQREVVEHGRTLEQAGDLIAAGEPCAHPLVLRGARDVGAFENDCAAVAPEVAGNLTDQSRLAGAVRADQGVYFSAPHVERDVVGGDDAAEPFRDVLKLKHVSPGGTCPRCPAARTARSQGAGGRPPAWRAADNSGTAWRATPPGGWRSGLPDRAAPPHRSPRPRAAPPRPGSPSP